MSFIDQSLEKNILPDWLIRIGIRRLLRERLASEREPDAEGQCRKLQSMVAGLREMPIAINTAAANTQHYEVPTAFFQRCLGSCTGTRPRPAAVAAPSLPRPLALCLSFSPMTSTPRPLSSR